MNYKCIYFSLMTERMGLVVSLPNWQPSVCQRQQWASQPCLVLSASDMLTETTFFALLFICGCSKLSSITTVTHEVSNKERDDAGQVDTPVSNQLFVRLTMPMCLCIFIHLRVVSDSNIDSLHVFKLFVSPSIYPSSCLSIHLSIHHCYLMRWHHTSRFIGCVQTNLNLIRPHHWNACPHLQRHWLHKIMTHLHLTV